MSETPAGGVTEIIIDCMRPENTIWFTDEKLSIWGDGVVGSEEGEHS